MNYKIIFMIYNNQKIGVGIITCNRELLCQQLFDSIKSIDIIDNIVIVKNKDFNYSNLIQHIKNDNITTLINVFDDLGVGYCKNKAFKYLLNQNCKHIFLIEDDTIIKKYDVFKKYIDTAKMFNIGHLIYGGCSPFKDWRKPIAKIINKNIQLDFYHHIKGEFCYYLADALQIVGLMDETYINAVEHIEHSYRLMKFGYCCGCFWAFPDIANSEDYLYNSSCESNYTSIINNQTEIQQLNIIKAHQHFYDVYNRTFNQFPIPNLQNIQQSVINQLQRKNIF